MANTELDQHKRALAEGKNLGPRMVNARYSRTNHKLTVEFDNGWGVIVPVADVKDFEYVDHAPTASELSKFEITGDGYYLFFPQIDVALYGPNFAREMLGEQAWQSQMAREFGSRKSEAKAAASRENGRKGGRPKKDQKALQPVHANC
jgi:hypothetical protein